MTDHALFRNTLRHLGKGMVFTAVLSCFVNLLMLIVPLYTMQVYDRVMTSRSSASGEPTSAAHGPSASCASGGIMFRVTPAFAIVQFILTPVFGSDKSRVCMIWCISS